VTALSGKGGQNPSTKLTNMQPRFSLLWLRVELQVQVLQLLFGLSSTLNVRSQKIALTRKPTADRNRMKSPAATLGAFLVAFTPMAHGALKITQKLTIRHGPVMMCERCLRIVVVEISV